jgi:hypothetical protein
VKQDTTRSIRRGAGGDPILQRLTGDPRFRVVSLDGAVWFCPVTGADVPLQGDWRQTALEYYRVNAELLERENLSAERILWYRWRYDLQNALRSDPRLSLFDPDGYWLNPFSGVVEESVQREGRRVTPSLIDAMAEVLVGNDAARRGALLPLAELQIRMRSSGELRRKRIESSHTSIQVDPEMARAGDAQRRMLGEVPPIDGYECAVDFVPHSSVSGDFYKVARLDEDRFLVCVGDVSGHGLQAGLVVSNTLRTLRFLCRQEKNIVPLIRSGLITYSA